MRYPILLEQIEESEGIAGGYYAHIPTLGLTTHGIGVEGAMAAARDLVGMWLEEKRANGEAVPASREPLLASIEVE